MVQEITISRTTRDEKYKELLPQIKGLVTGESDLIANLANIMAALKSSMGFLWIGIYLVKDKELVLGPFQGPVACTRIQKGNGVSGKVWQEKRTIIVADVDKFPGHIICSSESRSEIVLPIMKDNEVAMIMDLDSSSLNDFDAIDEKYLQEIVAIIEGLF
ncbi:MAG: GAF domain-containing protein [Flavobacteriales bacterium]|jgi:L-methionine (R)-S-oxide reductase|nr:GAF domain-containing protein [Flavobacteriales bacterium]